MPYIDLTEEECYWLGVAVADMKGRAEKLADVANDIEDEMDAESLVSRWTSLQEKFPEPIIKASE